MNKKKKKPASKKNALLFSQPVKMTAKVTKVKKRKSIFRKKVLLKKLHTLGKYMSYLRLPQLHPIATIKNHKVLSGFVFLVVVGSSVTFYWFILKDLPSPKSLTERAIPQTTLIRARDGQILFRIYKDANRVQLKWDEIPPVMKDATIAIEDADYYKHHGISIRSIVRAFLYNLHQNDKKLYQGGSTITQQLVKNRFLGTAKSYRRKLREIVLSPLVELSYSKKDILTMYLNEVGYGGPAYGAEAASQMYFNKSVKNISIAQAAFLAGMPAAPTLFSPFGANPEFATIRQQQVLDRMFLLKMISKDQYDSAKNEVLVFVPQRIDIKAPHFVFYVKDKLVRAFGEKLVNEGGLDVTTTLDLEVQEKAQEIVKKQVAQLGSAYRITNAATLVTAPTTGEILAMVGSVDYFDTANQGYVNVTNRPRQPGSAIKPVTYATAFENGYTPNTVIDDSPVVYVVPGSKESYAPQNYDGKFHGSVTVRGALANSYNVAAVKTLNKIGVSAMVATGRKMGIESWDPPPAAGLSLTLGGAEMTMIDISRAYGTIANMGVYKDLKTIKEIRDNHGTLVTDRYYHPEKFLADKNIVSEAKADENQQVISPITAWWLIDILSDNQARVPAFGYYAKLTVPDHKVAVKTGTTNNFRDNWTIGFTPDYLVASWVGNNDGSFMNKNLVSGITGAAPIWQETMQTLIADAPDKEFPKPAGMVAVKICAVNGLLTCPNCPNEKVDYFPIDKIPTKQCYFRPKAECEQAKKDSEGKTDEEKKALLNGCWGVN